MSEQDFHEIQLSKKQLVFVFMAAVVVAVGVFLLGVSFGRGVTPVTSAATVEPAPVSTPTTLPPATTPAASDLTYHDALQTRGQGTAQAAPPAGGAEPTPTAAASTPPPIAGDGPVGASPKGTPAPGAPLGDAKPRESAPPAATPTPKPADKPEKSPGAAEFALQIGAYSTKTAAEHALEPLRAKKYPVTVMTEPASTPGPRFKAVVGPFASRSEATRVQDQLKKDGVTSLMRQKDSNR